MAVMVIGKNRTMSDFNKAKKGLGGPMSQDCTIYGFFSTQGIRCKLKNTKAKHRNLNREGINLA
jgi:hypothetical protein